MKRCRLSYDEWKCILSKDLSGKRVNSETLKGYVGKITVYEVSKPQVWKFNGEDIKRITGRRILRRIHRNGIEIKTI